MRNRSPVVPTLVLGALVAGCTTSPKPHYIDVTGTWTYSASNMIGTDTSGHAVSCRASGSMSLVKSGSGTESFPDAFGGRITESVFKGTYSNLELVCTINGTPQTRGPFGATVSQGVISPYNPTTGEFFFDSDPDSVVVRWYNFDAVTSPDQMTGGSVTTTIDFGAPSGPVVLAGAFSAVNQH